MSLAAGASLATHTHTHSRPEPAQVRYGSFDDDRAMFGAGDVDEAGGSEFEAIRCGSKEAERARPVTAYRGR